MYDAAERAELNRQLAVLQDPEASGYWRNAQKVIRQIEERQWRPPAVENPLEKAKRSMDQAFQALVRKDSFYRESQQRLLSQQPTLSNRADTMLLALRINYESDVHKIEFCRDMQMELDKTKNNWPLGDHFINLCERYGMKVKDKYI